MGRRGLPGTGAAALALLTAVTAAGCGDSGDGVRGSAGDAPNPPTTSASSAPVAPSAPSTPSAPSASDAASAPPGPRRPLSGADLCVSAVEYWAREMLAGAEPYGDYQSMGLSNRQYDVLREVVDAARAMRRDRGTEAAGELIGRRTRTACAEGYRDGGPSRGPWQS
ncbi:hypothetical protein [Streptomyces sp. NPDC048225]|uniref:hypothetical protein n=1 Tax=Streptomyces sp. NPDC048225 TaxID=3365518 RepID=UPI003721E624